MEMDVILCKCNCLSFILYLPYVWLISYSTGVLQLSNDSKLVMTDGAYESH
jgi:hypothetical protein